MQTFNYVVTRSKQLDSSTREQTCLQASSVKLQRNLNLRESSITANKCDWFLFYREVSIKPSVLSSARSDQRITSSCPSQTSAVVQENSLCLDYKMVMIAFQHPVSPYYLNFESTSNINTVGHIVMLSATLFSHRMKPNEAVNTDQS